MLQKLGVDILKSRTQWCNLVLNVGTPRPPLPQSFKPRMHVNDYDSETKCNTAIFAIFINRLRDTANCMCLDLQNQRNSVLTTHQQASMRSKTQLHTGK